MQSRNLIFARSMLFGLAAKLVGSLVVFVGLPVIAAKTSTEQYKLFLLAMSGGSLAGLGFGALAISTVQSIAESVDDERIRIRSVVANALGAYLLLGLSILIVLAAGSWISGGAYSIPLVLATLLTVIQGVFQLGDTMRIARREDHVSSMFQMVGSLLMIAMLLLVNRLSATTSVLIYFGTPAFIFGIIFLDIFFREKLWVLPSFDLRKIFSSTHRPAPFIVNSLLEYTKIFGIGLILSYVASPSVYIRFQTAVLMAVRFINPLSLVTRPLLPNYINALRRGDGDWLRKVFKTAVAMILFCCGLLLIANLIFPYVRHFGAMNTVRDFTSVERYSLSAFLVGQATIVLSLPIFAARQEMSYFLKWSTFGVCIPLVSALLVGFAGYRIVLVALGGGVILTAYLLMSRLRTPPIGESIDAHKGEG